MRLRTTLAAVLDAPNELVIRPIPFPPKLGPSDVLLRICHVGICASDVKYWRYGQCGRFRLEKPMVVGHEASGVVQARGTAVSNLKIGDRVAIEPGVPCLRCHVHCSKGRYNLCEDMRFCATPPVDGNLCEYFIHDAAFCHKLPEEVDLIQGALVS